MDETGGDEVQMVPRTSRMDLIREHKSQLAVTISYCLAAVGLGLCIGMLGPTLLLLSAKLQRSSDDLGFIFSVRGFGYLLGSTTGPLYDKLNAHVIIICAILLFASMFIVASLATNIYVAVLIWGVVGFGGGCVDTGVNTLVVWVWRDKVNPFMQAIHFSWGVGVFISPMLVARMYELPLFTQYLIVAIPVFVTATPFFLLKSPKPNVDYKTQLPLEESVLKVVEDERGLLEANPELKHLAPDEGPEISFIGNKVDSGGDEDSARSSSDSATVLTANSVEIFKSVDLKKSSRVSLQPEESTAQTSTQKSKRLEIEVILFIAAFLCFYVGAELGYGGWLFVYAYTRLSISEVQAAYILAAFWGSFTFSRMAAIGIAVYLSPKMMILSDIAGCTIGLLILILGPNTEPILWIGSMVLGISLASIFPTAIALPQSLGVPVTGKGTSWIVVGASLGEMVIPMAIGYIQAGYGVHTLPYVIFAALTIALCIYVFMLARVSHATTGEWPIISKLTKRNSFARLDSTIQ